MIGVVESSYVMGTYGTSRWLKHNSLSSCGRMESKVDKALMAEEKGTR